MSKDGKGIDAIIHLIPSRKDWKTYIEHIQHQANRLAFGYYQYEAKNSGPHRRQKYLTRIKKELQAYIRTGNAEHLHNISNYCYLESQAPENRKFHFDSDVDSVTREKADRRDRFNFGALYE